MSLVDLLLAVAAGLMFVAWRGAHRRAALAAFRARSLAERSRMAELALQREREVLYDARVLLCEQHNELAAYRRFSPRPRVRP